MGSRYIDACLDIRPPMCQTPHWKWAGRAVARELPQRSQWKNGWIEFPDVSSARLWGGRFLEEKNMNRDGWKMKIFPLGQFSEMSC